jgi:predicted ATPase
MQTENKYYGMVLPEKMELNRRPKQVPEWMRPEKKKWDRPRFRWVERIGHVMAKNGLEGRWIGKEEWRMGDPNTIMT